MATQQLVSKDMVMADVIEQWPLAAEIMETYGLTCTGCSANTMDTVEAGARSHGIPDEQIEAMVQEINEAVSSGKAKAPAPIQPVKVTPKAAEKMQAILKEQHKDGWGIRVLVSAGGCAGYTYGMDFEQSGKEGDQVIEAGLKVFVDPASAKMLSGTTIDYVETLTESGFKFNNPTAKAGCGCGKSFN